MRTMVSDRMLRRVIRSDALVALVGDLVRAVIAVVAIASAAGYLLYDAALARLMFHDLHMNDFGKFYYSARAFLDGRDMYGPSQATAMPVGPVETIEFVNMNPPHFHLLVLPIARFEPLSAILIWSVLSTLALGFSVRAIAREIGIRWTPARVLWTIVGVLACSSTTTTILTGQVTFILLLPLTMAWIAARHGRMVKSATLLGVLASLKPFLAVFGLYLIVKRQWKAALTLGAVMVACFIVGLLLFGWQAHRSWLEALNSVQWTWAVMNGSLFGPLARAFSDNPFFEPFAHAPGLVVLIGTVLGISVVAIAIAAVARDSGPNAVDRSFALLILTALLASPLGWIYYLWLAVGPLVALWMSGSLSRWPIPAAIASLAIPGLLFPIELTLVAQRHSWGGFTIGSVYTWTVLCLWVSLLVKRDVLPLNGLGDNERRLPWPSPSTESTR
jgi:alpha-1,2-mannosyltransferase